MIGDVDEDDGWVSMAGIVSRRGPLLLKDLHLPKSHKVEWPHLLPRSCLYPVKGPTYLNTVVFGSSTLALELCDFQARDEEDEEEDAARSETSRGGGAAHGKLRVWAKPWDLL